MADSLAERVRRKRYAEGTLSPEELTEWYRDHPEEQPDGWTDPDKVEFDPSLIPDIEVTERQDDELQPYLDSIDILDAYARWCGKMMPRVGHKREGIKISCPDPTHPDKVPSAWVNLDKQVWSCGRDWTGGDKYDLAAWHFGYDVPSYKTDGSFPELRRKMVEDFGYIVKLSPGGSVEVEQSAPAPPLASVVPIPTPFNDDEDEDDRTPLVTSIDWEALVPDDTFLWRWMNSCTIDDLPHEFYFWMGMQALSAIAGRSTFLQDFRPVKANLFVCLYGRSGMGKSRAKQPLDQILDRVMPFSGDEFTAPSGVKILPAPGSAEALLTTFQHQLLDPSTMQPSSLAPIQGILTVEEFSSFVSRSARSGNPMKETLIELFDAFDNDVTSYSLGGGVRRARAPYCQMVTTTQPQAIHAFMRRTDVHSGFMNRFIFAIGTRRRERISHGGVKIDIDEATKYLEMLKVWSHAGHEMILQDEALTEWDDFYQGNIGPLYDRSDESMFSRLDLQLKKIMVLMCLNEVEDHPTPDIVQRTCALFPYLKSTYSLFSSDIGQDEDQTTKDAIIETIERYQAKHGKGASRREIVMRLTKKHGMDALTKGLAFLETNDVVRITQEGGTRGPKTRRYYISGD